MEASINLSNAIQATRLVIGLKARTLGLNLARPGSALLGVLLAIGLAPSARASCGDHIRLSARSESGAELQAQLASAQDSSPSLPEPESPCSGPHCSSSRHKAPRIPPAGPQGSNQWAVKTEGAGFTILAAGHRPEDKSDSCSLLTLSPPVPPPRLLLVCRI